MDKADRKRSFMTTAHKNPKFHSTSAYLFKRRLHALPTMAKLHDTGANNQKLTNLYRRYYKNMYPNDKCHACTKAGVQNPPKEDTEHACDCESVPGKVQLFEDTWTQIRQKVRSRSTNILKKNNVKYLYPFLASTERMRTETVILPAATTLRSLRGMQQAGPMLRHAGLVPADLVGALRECGVPGEEAPKLADEIALQVQVAEHKAFILRQKQIAADRRQTETFRTVMNATAAVRAILTEAPAPVPDITPPQQALIESWIATLRPPIVPTPNLPPV